MINEDLSNLHSQPNDLIRKGKKELKFSILENLKNKLNNENIDKVPFMNLYISNVIINY
jgi:flagellar basal body-associated protein FliL